MPASPSTADPALDALLGRLSGPDCVFFPIRHHSPACAWHLDRLIRALRPASVLVEGPARFTPLIPLILDPATAAPVAIYTHFVDLQRRLAPPADGPERGPARFAAYYPLCDYSPELAALRAGAAVGADLRFIDLDYPERVLAEHAGAAPATPQVDSLTRERHLQRSAYLKALADRHGCRDVNELWDHLFEADFRTRPTATLIRDVAVWCALARRDSTEPMLAADGTLAREAAMAAAIRAAIAAPARAGRPVVVVTGGYHTVALPDLLDGPAAPPAATIAWPAEEVQQALIRYGFEQLDALNGYAAGMPSPTYYDRLWQAYRTEAADPPAEVAAALIVEIGAATRDRGWQSALSTADEIAALQQARLLAALRGHPGPTREDLLDAVRSCFVKGAMAAEGAVVMALAAEILTGAATGSVPAGAGAPPIVASFHAEARACRLEIDDGTGKRADLDIYRSAAHRRTSRFLHRLGFLDVPFAAMTAGPDFARGTALDRMHELWRYAWTPRTDGALVAVAVYGATVAEAAANRLVEAIAALDAGTEARSALAAVALLVRACRMGLHAEIAPLARRIAAALAEDPAFTGAIGAAEQLLMLEHSREPLEAHGLEALPDLVAAAYRRACFLVPGLAACADAAVDETIGALARMRGLLAAGADGLLDPALFWEAAETALAARGATPAIAGAIAGLLHGADRMDEGTVVRMMAGHVAGGADDWRSRIGFLRGLLATRRETAWRSRLLAEALDRQFAAWDDAIFLSALPELRMAFADLTPRETDRTAELVAGLHGGARLDGLLQRHVTETEALQHRRITAAVADSLAADGLTE